MPNIVLIEQLDLADIRAGASQALERLQFAPGDQASSHDLLSHLDRWLADNVLQSSGSNNPVFEDLSFELGSLWGEQLVKSLGWRWIRVRFNQQAPEAIGVSSPNDSLVIYPFQTIFLYYERILPVRIARCFEILSEPGRVPMLPPGGLENVMDHIH